MNILSVKIWFHTSWLSVAAIDKTWNGYFRYDVTKHRFCFFAMFSLCHATADQLRAPQWMSVQKKSEDRYILLFCDGFD